MLIIQTTPDLPSDFLEILVKVWAPSYGCRPDFEPLPGRPPALLNDTTQEWEYFLREPGTLIFEQLVEVIREHPTRTITIMTHDLEKYIKMATKVGLNVILDSEQAMSVNLEQARPPAHSDDGFEASFESLPSGMLAKFMCGGKLAASGQVGVVDGIAVFHHIQTQPDFRRRGLGTYIMRMLSSWAHDKQGARTGFLIALQEGQALYKHLGWYMTYKSVTVGNAKSREDSIEEHVALKVAGQIVRNCGCLRLRAGLRRKRTEAQ